MLSRLTQSAADTERNAASNAAPSAPQTGQPALDETMLLDDTKDKVYIYDLDKEVAEIEAAEAEGKQVVFMRDIDRRLYHPRIPAAVLANREGELAGLNPSQALVLCDEPKSLGAET